MTVENAKKLFEYWQDISRKPGLTALLIVEILLIVAAAPIDSMRAVLPSVLPIVIALFVIAGLVIASQSYLAMALVLGTVVVNNATALIYQGHLWLPTAWLTASVDHTAICAVSWLIAKSVFGSGRVTIYRIQAAIVLYINIALFFFTTYRLMSTAVPNAFYNLPSGKYDFMIDADLLYFSLATLANVKYGDITPLNPMVRHLVTAQAVLGILYPVAIVVRLAVLELVRRRD